MPGRGTLNDHPPEGWDLCRSSCDLRNDGNTMKFTNNQLSGPVRRTALAPVTSALWPITWIGLVALILLALPQPVAHAAGFLHASGQDIVDQDGNKILLRGVGLGNW